MEIRFQNSPEETMQLNTDALRSKFLCTGLMMDDEIKLVYTHYDRMVIGGAKPVNKTIELPNPGELKADHFLQRRELGIINVGGDGNVITDAGTFTLSKLDCLYVGKETKSVSFKSIDAEVPATFYLLSCPAHHVYPTVKISKEDAAPVALGDITTSNKRVIYKYIHDGGAASCQLVMGLTILQEGSVWNSVPPHTHTRRMEAYFYFDVPAEQKVFHFMGQPQQTRHVVVSNHEAVVSPPWSVHFGCGTSNYGFIWGMAGENKEFTDMDPAPVSSLL